MSLHFQRITGDERPAHFKVLRIEVVYMVTAPDGKEYFFDAVDEAARWARQLHFLNVDESSPRQQHAPRRKRQPDA